MRKHVEESVATGAAAGRGRGGRFSAGRKREVVMRLLRGEDLESVSRAVGITAARAAHWRAQFLAAGQAGLKSRATDARDEDHRRLQAKIGELLMETELCMRRWTSWRGFVRLTLRAAQYRDAHSTIPLPSASLSARNHQPCRLALPQILHELPGC